METALIVAYIGIFGSILTIVVTVILNLLKDISDKLIKRNTLYYFVFIFCEFTKDVVSVAGSDFAASCNLYERLTDIHREELNEQRKIARESEAEVALALMHLLQAFENLDVCVGKFWDINDPETNKQPYVENIKNASSVLGKHNDILAWYCYKKLNISSKWQLRKHPYLKDLKNSINGFSLPSMLYKK